MHESDEQKAQRLTEEMLRKAGWTESELARRRKGDAQKARMAERLHRETPMSWAWIAKRLGMGHWRTASKAVRKTVLTRKG